MTVGPLGRVQYAGRKWVMGVCCGVRLLRVSFCGGAHVGRGSRVWGRGEALVGNAGAREGGLGMVGRVFVW